MISSHEKQGALNHKEIRKVILVIEELRKVHADINANQVLSFIAIAANPGITTGDIIRAIGYGSVAVARPVQILKKTHRSGQQGLDLIYEKTDLIDRRVKHLYLNSNGLRIWNSILRILEIETSLSDQSGSAAAGGKPAAKSRLLDRIGAGRKV